MEKNKSIKTIIFDLGDVVVNLDFSKFYKEIISPSPLNKPEAPLMMEFFRNSDLYHQGKMSNEEFYHMACDLLQVNSCVINEKEFFKAFNSIISGINNDVVNLIKELASLGKFKLIALSNVNESHWNYLKKKDFDFMKYFDEMILSHEVQTIKPEQEIFQIAIEKANCKPQEIVFVDDGLNNIKVAKDLGIVGIHFTDVSNLKEEFKKLNIL
ncbi:MAG: HAD family hydrolase [Promethearchaeota archaeon]|nr:MAG: HAD family hydrolase [Candidatus Lokiarchaeota archaeon]